MKNLFNKHKYFSSTDPCSKAHQFRRKRFELFLEVFDDIISNQERIDILDVGGVESFWKNMGIEKHTNFHILLLNIFEQDKTLPNIKSVVGDGCDMKQFSNNQFDIVISNSVIEHVGDFERQKKIAEEVQRVGKNYFVQTPNYYFPIEPHFIFPFFHWLPKTLRIFLLTHFNLGWYKRFNDKNEAEKIVTKIRLIKLSELKKLFPKGKIYKEKYLGLAKSFIICYNG